MRCRFLHFVLLLAGAQMCGSATAQSARIVASPEAAPGLRGQILREAIDPCLGLHWQWVADPVHPEWPNRMVLTGSSPAESVTTRAESVRSPLQLSGRGTGDLVIRAGDLITVRQETGILRASLQALALDSARAGHPLRVRLIVAGDRRQGMNALLTSSGPVITVIAGALREAVWSAASGGFSLQEQSR